MLALALALTLVPAAALATTTPADPTPPPTLPPTTAYEKACAELAARRFKTPEEKLKALFEFEWNHWMETYPEAATDNGLTQGQDRWTDMSLTAIALRRRESQCGLKLIESVDRAALKNPRDRLNWDLFHRDATENLEGDRFPSEFLAIGPMGGVHQSLPQLLQAMRREQASDYANMLARLSKADVLIQQNLDLLTEGLKRGITPPRQALNGVSAQFEPLLNPKLERNPLYDVFQQRMPDSIPEPEQRAIRERARSLISGSVLPALQRLRDFLSKTYIPGARAELAFTSLPDGEAWYAYLVRSHTTTRLSPKEIHELGLKETERIRTEMIEVMRASGWKKDLPSFFRFMRTDKRFFHSSREELLQGYRDIAKRADPELARLFGKLPRLPYGVKAVPEYAEAAGPTAYYEGGSPRGGRPGWFFANTYNLKSRPKWEMEPLTLHEAVPCHHLQIALAQEMEDVPEFRREGHFTAFVEGWGLYAESLGSEMGFYRDPYSRIGQLVYEMWRANRLVVDTGLHSFRWSRERAIEFMKGNMPKPEHDIRVEVDRYISMPGQALAYKIGQLKFLELRRRAQKELGDRFDIRAFHDEVLSEGALPLDLLETKLTEWIASRRKRE